MRPPAIAGFCLWAIALAGCQHVAQPPHPAAGRSSFSFYEAPAPTGRKAELNLATEKESLDVLVAARPCEPLAAPIYPPAAWREKAGSAIVGVRIEVDANGKVAEVGPSLVCFSTPGPHLAAFRVAVEAAVTQWSFTPAKHCRLERVPLPDGSVYWRNGGEERTETSFDVSFTFSAEGEVTLPAVR